MPLCTLEIPKSRFEAIAPDAREPALTSICNLALDETLTGLGVPDEKDRESRIVVTEGDYAKISVAFTVGPDEYPDYEQTKFFPTEKSIHGVGEAILALAKDTELEMGEVRMEAWAGTTFKLRDLEAGEPIEPPAVEAARELGNYIREPRVRVVLSPKKLGGASVGKEGEPSSELQKFSGLGREIYRGAAEILGLPKVTEDSVQVLPTHYADSDISVEFDCQPDEGRLIPEEVRRYIAARVEQVLNTNDLSKGGEAEIWIRQGQPATVTSS